MDQLRSYAGQFLLALPGMEDMRFDHSVIAICVHDENGALGIAVSDEIEGVGLHELLESFDINPANVPDIPVLRGGPVEPRRDSRTSARSACVPTASTSRASAM